MKKDLRLLVTQWLPVYGRRATLLLVLTGLASTAFGQLTFAPRVDYPSGGTNPYGVAVADLNGDGRPDVVAANNATNNVSVLLGQPAVGTLGTATVYSTGASPIGVALGDVNGDGRLDIVTANSGDNSIGILLGSTTTPGTFQPVLTYAAGSQPRTVALGDVNGDGRLDVVVPNFNSNTVTVLLNAAATPGTFPTTAAYISNGTSTSGAVLGDVNGDGRLDIVTSSNIGSAVGVLLNLAAAPGTFGAVVSYGSGTASPFNLTLGDMNNDGRLDIVAGSLNTGGVGVLLNSAATPGTFAAAASYNTGMNSTIELAVGDLNGDGRLDVAAGGVSTNAVGTLLGSSATPGTLVSPQTFSTGASSATRGVALYDLNGDGRQDIIEASLGTNNIGVFINTTSVAPTVTNLNPNTGPVGTSVILSGTNFSTATAVTFNGTAATSFTVNSATQITATVPAGATTGNVTVTTAGGLSNGLPFTVTFPDLVISTPGQSIPAGTYNSITVNSGGVGTLTGNVTVNTSTSVNSGGRLNDGCFVLGGGGTFTLAAGATLGICNAVGISASGATGAIQNTASRTFSTDASYVYNGAGVQITGSGLPSQVRNLTTTNASTVTLSLATSVAQVLTVGAAGNLATGGNPLTLLSSASGTAMVVNSGSGAVTGTATVQRYIDPSLNPGLGYRHYSSPVQSTTVADLATPGFTPVVDPVYNTQGNTVTPFPTVFGYDESRLVSTTAVTQSFDYGFFSPASLGSALTPGRGYTVNLAASEKVDLVGTLNTGTVAVGSLTRGSETNSGWHLLGNPYPAPLDWKLARTGLPAGVLDAVYVFKSSGQYMGAYQFYQNGFGTLPDGLIGSMQGFFVRVAQPVPAFSFSNSWRATSYVNPSFNRGSADTRPALQLDLVSAQGTHEPTFVYFEQGATAGFDVHYDAEKLPNSTGLNLSSEIVGMRLAVNGLPPATTATVVPLAVGVPLTGTYTLQAASLANFGTAPVYLLDALTGQQVNLQQQPTYSFTASNAALITGRFSLSFEPARPTAVRGAQLGELVQLFPNPAHTAATLALPPSLVQAGATLTVVNAIGQTLRTHQLSAAATHTLNLKELPVGVYTLRLALKEGVVVKRLVID